MNDGPSTEIATTTGAFGNNRRVVIALVGVIALAVALRLYRLDYQSLWWDEAITVAVVKAPLSQQPGLFKDETPIPVSTFGWNSPMSVQDFNPPVYFAVLHAWSALVGDGPRETRLLSAAAGSCSVLLLFLIGRRLYDEGTALIAAVLLAVSQLGIAYSQEARNYSLLMLLFLTTLYFFLVATSTRRLLAWCCCVVSAMLVAGTHYFGVFALAALVLYVIAQWRRTPLPTSWLAVAALACCALLTWFVLTLSGQVSLAHPKSQFRWTVVRWTTPFSALNQFNNGALDGIVNTMPRWTFIAGVALFTLPAVMMVVRWVNARRWRTSATESAATSLCVLMALLPVLAVLAVGLTGVQYGVRYILYCIAPYYLLVAAGIWRMRPAIRYGLLVGTFLYSVCALRANYYIPYKEDFRGAAGYVAARALETDCYAFVPFQAPPLGWRIYMPGPPRATVIDPDAHAPELPTCQRTWLVTYERGMDETPVPAQWQRWIKQFTSSHEKADGRQFFWIRVELYTLRQAAQDKTRA